MWGSKLLGNYAKRAGVQAGKLALGSYGATATSAFYGGVAGAAYGALSQDTSVLGGMMGGAALGAGAARYGGAAKKAFRRGRAPGDGSPIWGNRELAGRMARSALGQMKGDALLAGNRAVNGFSALRRRMGR